MSHAGSCINLSKILADNNFYQYGQYPHLQLQAAPFVSLYQNSYVFTASISSVPRVVVPRQSTKIAQLLPAAPEFIEIGCFPQVFTWWHAHNYPFKSKAIQPTPQLHHFPSWLESHLLPPFLVRHQIQPKSQLAFAILTSGWVGVDKFIFRCPWSWAKMAPRAPVSSVRHKNFWFLFLDTHTTTHSKVKPSSPPHSCIIFRVGWSHIYFHHFWCDTKSNPKVG